jgi:predicted small secreted protein
MPRHLLSLLIALVCFLLAACGTTGVGSGDPMQLEYRRLSIAAEPAGNYFVGRRFHLPQRHFWGSVRRPGESWDQSKLVVINEKFAKQPDRYPEIPAGEGPAYGSDHNREYRLWGYFSGRRVYDPNSDLMLPEFVLQRYELKNESPGWLFKPNEKFNGQYLLRDEPSARPGARF